MSSQPRARRAATEAPAYEPVPISTARAPSHGGSSVSARSSARATTERPAAPSSVSVPTRLEVRDAVWNRSSRVLEVVSCSRAMASERFTWPAISRSPTTIASRPDATAKRCSVTSGPVRTVKLRAATSPVTPDAWATSSATWRVACFTLSPLSGASTSR